MVLYQSLLQELCKYSDLSQKILYPLLIKSSIILEILKIKDLKTKNRDHKKANKQDVG